MLLTTCLYCRKIMPEQLLKRHQQKHHVEECVDWMKVLDEIVEGKTDVKILTQFDKTPNPPVAVHLGKHPGRGANNVAYTPEKTITIDPAFASVRGQKKFKKLRDIIPTKKRIQLGGETPVTPDPRLVPDANDAANQHVNKQQSTPAYKSTLIKKGLGFNESTQRRLKPMLEEVLLKAKEKRRRANVPPDLSNTAPTFPAPDVDLLNSSVETRLGEAKGWIHFIDEVTAADRVERAKKTVKLIIECRQAKYAPERKRRELREKQYAQMLSDLREWQKEQEQKSLKEIFGL